jgi:hypothetical protein
MEPLTIYHEVSPSLRRELRLFSDKVSICGRKLAGDQFETHVSLEHLSPDVGTMRFRSSRSPIGIAVCCTLIVFLWLFVGPFDAPWASTRVLVTASLAIASLGWGLYYLPRYTAYNFLNTSGQLVLNVIASDSDRENWFIRFLRTEVCEEKDMLVLI